jgi:hypothetical protein
LKTVDKMERLFVTSFAVTGGIVYAGAALASFSGAGSGSLLLQGFKRAGSTTWAYMQNHINVEFATGASNVISDGISQYITFSANPENLGKNFFSSYNFVGGLTNYFVKNPFVVDFVSSGLVLSFEEQRTTSLLEAFTGAAVGGTLGRVQGKYFDPFVGDIFKDVRARGIGFVAGTIGNLMADSAVSTAGALQESSSTDQNKKQ